MLCDTISVAWRVFRIVFGLMFHVCGSVLPWGSVGGRFVLGCGHLCAVMAATDWETLFD